MTPIVFLDIDGVLVTETHRGRHPSIGWRIFEPSCVEQLNRITDTTGASIVISSSWRGGAPGKLALLVDYFREQGIRAPVLGRTPELTGMVGRIWVSKERGHEIQAWLDQRRDIGSFVILDDDADMVHLAPRLVQTLFKHGLTREDADRAIALLRGGL